MGEEDEGLGGAGVQLFQNCVCGGGGDLGGREPEEGRELVSCQGRERGRE